MKLRKRLAIYAAAFLLTLSLFLTSSVRVQAVANCSAGKTMNIVAHQDDDLLFINPAIMEDIADDYCVETVFVTAGNGDAGSAYWLSREEGMKAAYAQMAGVSNTWTQGAVVVLGHTMQQFTLNSKPEITLLFMRLPDGGDTGFPSTNYETLKKLWLGTISVMNPVDGSAAYTRQELIEVLRARMAVFAPQTIRTLDHTGSFGDGDHNDHHGAAFFASEAFAGATLPASELVSYQGYNTLAEAANVSGSTLTAKQQAFFTYDQYDNNDCISVSVCNDQDLLDWLERSYVLDTSSTGGLWSYETLEGDSESLSQYNATVGAQPAAVEFNGAMYAFYYDQSQGDLRFAKKGSQWSFGTLDGAGGANGRISADVGQTPTATVYGNSLQLFYYDASGGDLRHAWTSDGSNWNFETLDGAGGANGRIHATLGQTPNVLTYGTSLQLFYYDASNTNLRHAWSDASGWHFENFDGGNSAVSGYTADVGLDPAATVYGSSLQIFYYDASTGNLRHAWSDASGWHFENLDGDTGSVAGYNANVGGHPSTAVWDDTLHTFYYDHTQGNLRHMWTSPTNGWQAENIIGDANAVVRYDATTGLMSSAYVHNGQLQVLLYDNEEGNLVRLWDNGVGWRSEQVDGFGITPAGGAGANVGYDPAMISIGNTLHAFYFDVTNGNLRHAFLQ